MCSTRFASMKAGRCLEFTSRSFRPVCLAVVSPANGDREAMKSHTRKVLVGAGVAASWLMVATAAGAYHNNGDRSNEVKRAIDGGKAKNVIMFLGDGMGDSEITIARNYHVGAAGRLLDGQPPADRRVHDLRRAEGHHGRARLRHRLRRLGHRMGDRPQDLQQRHLGRPGHRCAAADDPRAPRRTPGSRPATSRPPNSPTRRRQCSTRTSACVVARARPT